MNRAEQVCVIMAVKLLQQSCLCSLLLLISDLTICANAMSASQQIISFIIIIITTLRVLQGSIQATLAAAPLELAHVYKGGAHHYTAWAEAITVVGVYNILLGATMAWLSAAFLGPALLTKVCVVSRSVLAVLSCACIQLYNQH